jgi:hypothetical protein
LLEDYVSPDGQKLSGRMISAPENDLVSAFKWDGEWRVTYITFRDMGAAFAGAMLIIYILVVWEFGSFRVPLIIISPIPLTMIGIMFGHWLWGAEFTATSMIGFIALAGIIVRNSILLVDFAQEKVNEGMGRREAFAMAGQARMRPIVITALALMGGSTVILTDPIFQGMAISLFFGVLIATLLTLIVIPMGCDSWGKIICETEESDPCQDTELFDADSKSKSQAKRVLAPESILTSSKVSNQAETKETPSTGKEVEKPAAVTKKAAPEKTTTSPTKSTSKAKNTTTTTTTPAKRPKKKLRKTVAKNTPTRKPAAPKKVTKKVGKKTSPLKQAKAKPVQKRKGIRLK